MVRGKRRNLTALALGLVLAGMAGAAELKPAPDGGFQASLTIAHGWAEGLSTAGSFGECAGAYLYRAKLGPKEALVDVANQAALEHIDKKDRKLFKAAMAAVKPADAATTVAKLIAPDTVEAKRETALEEGIFLKWLGERLGKSKGLNAFFGTVTEDNTKAYVLIIIGPEEGRPAARDTLVAVGTGKDGFCK